MPMNCRPRRGLTLLELTIVLAILGILTLVAVLMTDGVVDQGRYDVTVRTLDNVRSAILGPVGQADGPSFVADVGRLPQVVPANPTDLSSEPAVAELWEQRTIRTYGPPAEGFQDPDIRLFSGWRGPYLRIATGNSLLRDGWGQPFALFQPGPPFPDGSLPSAGLGTPVGQLRSPGGPTAPYNIPVALTQPISDPEWHGVVQGTLTVIRSTSTTPAPGSPMTPTLPSLPTTVQVQLYRPAGDLPEGVQPSNPDFPLTFVPGSVSTATTQTDVASFVFSNVPAGPVALRAYYNGSHPKMNPRSAIAYIRIPPRGTIVRDLYLTITMTSVPTP